jgi:DNA-binding transcriptional ArsR family regulator
MAFIFILLHVIIIFNPMNILSQPSISSQPFEAQASLLKLLTHPARLAILSILREGEHCVCHMEAHLGFRQAYISQQLAVLRAAGFIQDRRDGWNIFYRVTDPRIYTILDATQAVLGETGTPHPAQEVHCPCPKCNA